MTRKQYEQRLKLNLTSISEIVVVEDTVNELIRALYIPCTDDRTKDGIDWVADPVRCKKFGIEDEPINWGDLKCVEAMKTEDETWHITIDEADPHCPTLVAYIERFMTQWGWKVRVGTEW